MRRSGAALLEGLFEINHNARIGQFHFQANSESDLRRKIYLEITNLANSLHRMASAPTLTPDSANQGIALTGKYLTFSLAEESYCVPVLKVREIITMLHITTVPQMPPYVKGVINLRGRVIPVIDLRTKLGLPAAALTDSNCIVVVQITQAGMEIKNIGLIVDAVQEVVNLTQEDIEPAPDFGGSINVEYLLGMATLKGNVKSLLDIDKVIAVDALLPALDGNA